MDDRKIPKHVFILVVFISIITRVAAQQRFKEEPEAASVILGSTVVLRCTIENRIGDVQWTRDGFGLGQSRDLPDYPRYSIIGSADRGEHHLMIANAQIKDDALFDCQVLKTPTTEHLQSKSAQVTVFLPPSPPTIDGGSNVRVVVDEPFNLTCRAKNARPAPNITWYSEGDELSGDTFYVVEDQADGKRQDASGAVTIVPHKADQGKEHVCYVNNPATINPLWVKTYLEVLYKPEVTMTVTPTRRIKEFESMRFSCEAKGNPNVITWKWYEGDKKVEGASSSDLDLIGIKRELHGKAISCEASNEVGSSNQSYTLSMEYGPKFTGKAGHAAVDLEEDATLTCTVDGNPQPAIIWRKKGSEKILSSQEALKVFNVKDEDFGWYTCLASVIGFGEIEKDVALFKKDAPVINSPSKQYARYGSDGYVECDVRSLPKPDSITWLKDDKPLDLANLDRYQVREQETITGRTSVIEIKASQEGDYAEYTCTVVNSYGEDSLTISLERKDVAPLAYILAGVLVGIIILIIIAVAVFLYHRRKNQDSDSGSEDSSTNIKKRDGSPDIKIEYKDDIYGNVANWRPEFDQKFYRHSADYDELRPQPPINSGYNTYDTRDGPYNHGYAPDYRRNPNDIYGTYPRHYDPRYDPMYGHSAPPSAYPGSDYGTYNRAPSRGAFMPPPPLSDAGVYHPVDNPYGEAPYLPPPPPSESGGRPASRASYMPPPADVSTSKLATNV